MRKIYKFTMVGFFLFTSACSSLNGVARENTNPINGEPISFTEKNWKSSSENNPYRSSLVKKYGSDAEMVAKSTVQEINQAFFGGGYASTYPQANFEASYEATSAGARIDMNWSSDTFTFPLGKYQLNSVATQSYNSREGLAFVDLASQGIAKTIENLRAAGIQNYEIEATMTGMADSTPIRSRLRYTGEYGTVRLSREQTTLNGSPHGFTIKPNQLITNEELASLRAVSLQRFLHAAVRGEDITDKYNIKTSKMSGAKYRTASVSITIFER